MSALAQARPLAGFRIHPRPRRTELLLLRDRGRHPARGRRLLGATMRLRAAAPSGGEHAALDFLPPDAQGLLVYLGALLAVQVAFVLSGRRTDQVLLPAVAMLGGLGLLLMQRLPQDLVTQSFGGTTYGLGQLQLGWLLVALSVATVLALVVRSDAWLRTYKYTWAAAGIALLLLVFVFGSDTDGARLSLSIGPLSGQPSELLKVILVVFLAGYLSENRALLAEENTRIGPLRLPPLPYLAPMVAMWAIALGIVVVQRDLGAALLFFAVFLALLYVATGRPSYVMAGSSCSSPRRSSCTSCSVTSRTASMSGWTPGPIPRTLDSRSCRRCTRSAGAGSWAWAWGPDCRRSAGGCRCSAVHTDFPLAAIGEEELAPSACSRCWACTWWWWRTGSDSLHPRTTTSGRCWLPASRS